MPKPKDFTESAIHLVNPAEVKDLLDQKSTVEILLSNCEEQLKQLPVFVELQGHQKALAELDKQIRQAIEEYGSYQDTLNERYGVKYARQSKVYHVEPFKANYPKYVSAVVVETINSQALEGLVKGKLIEEDDLKGTGALSYTVSHAFFIR